MTDTGRQGLGDKVSAAVKPNNEKTYAEQTKDTVFGKGDKLASTAQPQSEKSTTQKAGDAITGQHNHDAGDKTLAEKAKEAVGLGKK